MVFYLFTKYTSTLSNNLLDLYDEKPFRDFSYAFMRREVALVVLMQWLCWFLFPIFGLGYYLWLRFSFAYFVALDSDLGVAASLKKSWELTRGKVGVLFILNIIFGIIGIISFGYFFLCPFFTMIYVYLYRKLSESDRKISESV